MISALTYQRIAEGFILYGRLMNIFNVSVHYSIILVICVRKLSFMIKHKTNDYV
jgi:hypothetical protein